MAPTSATPSPPTNAQLVLGSFPALDASGVPIAFAVQVQRQDRICRSFNPLGGSQDSRSTFRASNGMLLRSESGYAPSNCKDNGYVFLRGGDSEYDNKLMFFDPTDHERLQVAVAEYNQACIAGTAPVKVPLNNEVFAAPSVLV